MSNIPELDQFLRGSVERRQIPGVVAVVADKDRVLYHQAFGTLDASNGVDLSHDSIFRIMSMTKPVTSVMVMSLYEAAKLELDDPISRYLPRFKDPQVIDRVNEADGSFTSRPATRDITIRDLLTHTAGFGYAFSNPTAKLLEEKANKAPDTLSLLHDPGDRWTYGPSTRILGELVAQFYGASLEEVFQAKVFTPLGMPDTSYCIPENKYDRWVNCHLRQAGSMIEQPRPDVYEPAFNGDSGLFSTGTDYIRFLQMLLNGGTLDNTRILDQSSVGLMIQNHIGDLVVGQQPGAIPEMSAAFPLGAERDKFGLGFQIAMAADDSESTTNRRAPGSYGWSGLYNTHFWVDPTQELAAIFLTQLLPFYDSACMEVFQGFEELIYQHLR